MGPFRPASSRVNLTAVAGIRPLPRWTSVRASQLRLLFEPLMTAVVDYPKRRDRLDAGSRNGTGF